MTSHSPHQRRKRSTYLERKLQDGERLDPFEILELSRRDELRLKDNPYDLELLQMVEEMPEDRELQELASMRLQDSLAEATREWSEDPFWPNYAARHEIALPPDLIHVGTLGSGLPAGFGASRVFCGVAVIGAMGAGKSELVKKMLPELVGAGFRVIVFSRKRGEYEGVATVPELRDQSGFLDYSDLRLSLFQPPPGVPEERWRTDVNANFARASERWYAQRITQKILDEMARRYPAGRYVTPRELLEALENYNPGRGMVEARYKESMAMALDEFLRGTGRITDYASSNMPEVLFEGPGLTCITMVGLSQVPYIFLCTHLARWLYMKRQYQLQGAYHPPVAFVFEDATLGADEAKDRRSSSGTSPLAELFFMARAYSIGCFLLSHNISSVSQKILSNVENVYVLGLPGEHPGRISQLLGTSREQTDQVRKLRPGQFIQLCPSIWPEPMYGTFERLKTGGELSQDEKRRMKQRFLRQVQATKARPESRATGDAEKGGRQGGKKEGGLHLSSDALGLLVVASRMVDRPLTRLYDTANLSRKKGAAVVKRLESRDVVKKHRFSTGGRGGRVTLLEVTARGRQALKRKGMEPPDRLTQGGWEHDLAARLIKRAGKNNGYTVDFEVDLGPVRADVRWTTKQGEKRYFNIGISRPDREAKKALEAVSLPGIDGYFVLVCRDSKFKRKVGKKLGKEDCNGKLSAKVQLRLIADYLDAN